MESKKNLKKINLLILVNKKTILHINHDSNSSDTFVDDINKHIDEVIIPSNVSHEGQLVGQD